MLASVAYARGDMESFRQAVRAIGDAPSEYFYEHILPMGAALISVMRARAAQSEQQWTVARELLESALTRIRSSEYRVLEPSVLNELARGFLAQQQFSAAHETLQDAATKANQLELRVARLEIAVTQLELARVQQRDVAVARMRARHMLDEFLPFVPNEFRASFLQTRLAQSLNDEA